VPEAPNHQKFSSRLLHGQVFERKLKYEDVTGYLWGLENFRSEDGDKVEMKDRPCIVDIHGGPHWFRDAYFMEFFNILLNLGYLILTVNYSGSWSFTSDFNDRLAGKMGNFQTLILKNRRNRYWGDRSYYYRFAS
jgi:dipeptidyl aminopeptidase/acylaminoacyl peptidase